MKSKQIYFFIGTTAELIKLAPVIREFRRRKIDFKIITSGQTDVLFNEFQGFIGSTKADITLPEKENKWSVFIFILWAMKAFFMSLFLFRKEFKGLHKKNSYFIVHGDTVSSMIGALVASFYGSAVVHVESGLRSFNFLEPFPEEACRFITSHVADIHFCPNQWAVNNLKSIKGVKINTQQNTLIESFWWAIKNKGRLELVRKIKQDYFVLIMHRQEHVIFRKDWSRKLLEFILSNAPTNLVCIFITHEITSSFLRSMNPRLYKQIKQRMIVIPRLPFTEFMELLSKAEFVITDGGSNQEELYYMGKPCLLIRNRTERIEGLDANVVLSRCHREVIKDFLNNYDHYKRAKVPLKESPSKIIVDYLINH